MGPLYHFSEEPDIAVFEPRALATRPGEDARVWAIDGWHAPMYYFPRECPRILVWPTPSTTATDRALWFGRTEARMVAHVERAWLERMGAARLYRYVFDAAGFVDLGDAGMSVSQATVRPKAVEPVGDLFEALRRDGVELRVLERLTPLRGAWQTTLHASGIRLRNAQDWDVPDS